MKLLIFRLTDTEIVVDHQLFVKSKHGVYVAEREELRGLNVFRKHIDLFLRAEEKRNKEQFELELTNMLIDCNINYLGNYRSN
jgi:hypothetical protein